MLNYNQAANRRLKEVTVKLQTPFNRTAEQKLESEKRFLEESLADLSSVSPKYSETYYHIRHGLTFNFEKFFEGFWVSNTLKADLEVIREEVLNDSSLYADMDKELDKQKSSDFCLLAVIVLNVDNTWQTIADNMGSYKSDATQGMEGFNTFWRCVKDATILDAKAQSANYASNLVDVLETNTHLKDAIANAYKKAQQDSPELLYAIYAENASWDSIHYHAQELIRALPEFLATWNQISAKMPKQTVYSSVMKHVL